MRRKTVPKYYDPLNDLVQCQICYQWFKTLVSHVTRIHKMSGEEYKEEFGLWNGDMMSMGTREKISKKKKEGMTEEKLRKFIKKVVKYPKKKKLKARFKILRKEFNFFDSPEIRKKAKKALVKYRKTNRYKKDIKRAAKTRRRGGYKICEVCYKRYYVKRYLFKKSKCCSKKCMANHPYTKQKIKEFWKSRKGDIARKRASKRIKQEWKNGKRKGGWHWHKKGKND
jgi:hypothetical protein